MLSDKFSPTAKNAVTNIVLVTNAFVWYYLAIKILYDISTVRAFDSTVTAYMWSIHFAAIMFSALIGAFVGNKVKRTRLLGLWMTIGILSSLFSIVLDTAYVPNVFALSLLLGISLGLGMPTCMGYFKDTIKIENRSSVGGIILLLSGVGFALLGTTSTESIGLQTYILSVWRIFGLSALFLSIHAEKNLVEYRVPSYKSMFGQRNFILYLVPWLMFSLVMYLTIPLQSQIIGQIRVNSPDAPTIEFLRSIENILIGVFAVVGGFLSDIVGRKRVSIVGFVTIGLAYSVVGILPGNILSWYFYTACDGIALGMLYVIFVVTIWGDLSYHVQSDKYYAVGVLPFFISKFLQLTIGDVIATTITTTAIFSFTALFLFLAVLPLVYAPETLPEKIIKDRELKNYLEKAKQIAEKAQKDEENKEKQREDEDSELEFTVESPEDREKAEELAEKYY
jgi:MFS family permease